MAHSGGRFDFDDGGTYCGGWQSGKAHGHGICSGPNGQGEFSGSWSHGFEVIGVYTWPSGNTYSGNWLVGKRHGLGVETKGIWMYKGEWSHGYKGRYGIRCNVSNRTRYEGTWGNGLPDGYGTETYDDGGTYQGQWMDGKRHGYGVRRSAPYDIATAGKNKFVASSVSVQDSSGAFESPGGFVLSSKRCSPLQSAEKKRSLFRRRSFDLKKSLFSGLKLRAKSTSSLRPQLSRESSVVSTKTYVSDFTNQSSGTEFEPSMYNNGHHLSIEIASNTTGDKSAGMTVELYEGEWKNDKREGYGVCQRTDGYKYEGQWIANYRHGYGCTKFKDGTKEEGKYKENVLVLNKKWGLLTIKRGKTIEKVRSAVKQAKRAKEVARFKAEIASSRTQHGIEKAEQAEVTAENAKEEAKVARCAARDLDPTFKQPGINYVRKCEADLKGEKENSEHSSANTDQDKLLTTGVHEERRKLPFWKHPHYQSTVEPVVTASEAQPMSSTATELEDISSEKSASPAENSRTIFQSTSLKLQSKPQEETLTNYKLATNDLPEKNKECPQELIEESLNEDLKALPPIKSTTEINDGSGVSVDKRTSLDLYISTYESGMIQSRAKPSRLDKTNRFIDVDSSDSSPYTLSEKPPKIILSEHENLGLNHQSSVAKIVSPFSNYTNDVHSKHEADLETKSTSMKRSVKEELAASEDIKKYSPLPSKLRSKITTPIKGSPHSANEPDTNRMFLHFLAMILYLGFAALIYQFQF